MTVPVSAELTGNRPPSAREKASANQLRRILASRANDTWKLRVLDGRGEPVDITLMPALSHLLMEVLRHVGKGDAVTLVPVSQMLTTQQAANILNVSRPFFIGLLKRGEIVHTTVGRHRRIRAEHLFEYKNKRDTRRAASLSELAELDADHL